MQNLNQKQLFTTLGVLFAIFLCYVLYQAAIVAPRDRIQAIEAAAEREAEAQLLIEANRLARYDQCMVDAWQNYSANWDSTCVLDGKEPDCSLPLYRRAGIEETYATEKDRCVEMYK